MTQFTKFTQVSGKAGFTEITELQRNPHNSFHKELKLNGTLKFLKPKIRDKEIPGFGCLSVTVRSGFSG